MKKFLLIGLLLAACQQNDPDPSEAASDYIIFGHFYGECSGEICIEMFKLTNEYLYEEISDSYPSSQMHLDDFVKLDNTLFEKVKMLKAKVPQELLATTETAIGQPDAGDWGGIYFEISENGQKKYWLIDKMRSNLPAYVVPFVEEIENSIELINN